MQKKSKQIHELLLAILALGLVLATASCMREPTKSSVSQLKFTTIEQAERNSAGPLYQDENPNIIIVTSLTGVSQLEPLLSENGRNLLRDVDYQTTFVIGLFQGIKPTDRYGAQIERITARDNTVLVFANFTTPRPDEKKSDVMTSPYHIVQVSRPISPAEEFTFELSVAGTTILSTTHQLSQ